MRHRKAVTIVGLAVFAILAAGSMDTGEGKRKAGGFCGGKEACRACCRDRGRGPGL